MKYNSGFLYPKWWIKGRRGKIKGDKGRLTRKERKRKEDNEKEKEGRQRKKTKTERKKERKAKMTVGGHHCSSNKRGLKTKTFSVIFFGSHPKCTAFYLSKMNVFLAFLADMFNYEDHE